MKNFKKVSALTFALGLVTLSSAYAYTPLTAQIGLGSKGSNVTNLQTLFADNNSIYPSGLVTGYFGGMTKTAVEKFQANYGLAQVGRVGPQTLTKVNQIINAGGWNGNTGGNGNNPSAAGMSPTFYSVNKSISNNSATFSWVTDENVNAKVFYNTYPITVNEGDINSLGFVATNGYTVTSSNAIGLSQQVILSNLQPNTTYYYMLVSTDMSGNVSVFDANGTFRTSSN
jgi:peptidoglycan hydrolase-like protein with peptidoglycan-binding domain